MDGIGRKIPSPPWGSTHGQTTSGVTCNHSPWMTNMVERCRAWHDITALGLHARSDDVMRVMISPPLDSTPGRYSGRGITSPPLDSTHGRQRWAWHDITALGQQTSSDDVGRGMTSPPLGSTHGRTMSGMTFHHRLSEAHTVERRQAWHAIIALGWQTWSNDVERGMRSLPLDCTHGRTKSGVA